MWNADKKWWGNDKSWIFEKRSGNDNLKFFQDLKNFLKQFKIV
jgi:hypothetical protein